MIFWTGVRTRRENSEERRDEVFGSSGGNSSGECSDVMIGVEVVVCGWVNLLLKFELECKVSKAGDGLDLILKLTIQMLDTT